MAKREKQIFSDTSGVSHRWAHQQQQYAANPHRNFYFQDKTIYSYGSHFPIAHFYRFGTANHDRVVLFTTHTYSNTTAGHIGEVRRAIPDSYKVFNVPNVQISQGDMKDKWRKKETLKWHLENMVHLHKALTTWIETDQRAREKVMTYEIQNSWDKLNDYIEFFDLRKFGETNRYIKKELLNILEKDWIEAEVKRSAALAPVKNERGKIKREKDVIKYEAERQAAEERRREQQIKNKEKIDEWLRGQHGKNEIAHIMGNKILLRVKIELDADVMEIANGEPIVTTKKLQTSKGYEVDYDKAKTLWKLVQRAKKIFDDGKLDYVSKVVQGDLERVEVRGEENKVAEVNRYLHVEDYEVDDIHVQRINQTGSLHIGCHHIEYGEMEKIAKQEGWA